MIEAPQPGEVVVPGLQEIKIPLKGLKSLSPRPRLSLCLVPLLDRRPKVRPRQVNRPTRVVGEIPRIRRVLPERFARWKMKAPFELRTSDLI
jgi:hypothetical protein